MSDTLCALRIVALGLDISFAPLRENNCKILSRVKHNNISIYIFDQNYQGDKKAPIPFCG
jgi:hypothetical protein